MMPETIPSLHFVDLLREADQSLAVAESLTGGKLCAFITAVPGASDVFVGGVIAYQRSAKGKLLSIDSHLIDTFGVVSQEVAIAMADGIRESLASTWAIATTGVAGPGESDGVAAGTVWIAIRGPVSHTMKLELPGDREEVRNATVCRAIGAFERILTQERGEVG